VNIMLIGPIQEALGFAQPLPAVVENYINPGGDPTVFGPSAISAMNCCSGLLDIDFLNPLGSSSDPVYTVLLKPDLMVAGGGSPDLVTGAAVPETPLPTTLPLFASGIGGLGLLVWRRKRKAAASLVAA
jgi:hypothetical protein